MTVEYNLVLAFDTDDVQFCRGVEVGSVWTELEQALRFGSRPEVPGIILVTNMHLGNEEMARRMAKAKGLSVRIKPLVDGEWSGLGWFTATFERLPR